MITFQPNSTTSRQQAAYARYVIRNQLWERVRVQSIRDNEPVLRTEQQWRDAAAVLADGRDGYVTEEANVNMPGAHWQVCGVIFSFLSEEELVHFKLSV